MRILVAMAMASVLLPHTRGLTTTPLRVRNLLPSNQRIILPHLRSTHASFSLTRLSAVPLTVPSKISQVDNTYMKLAIEAAARGKGNTFPNPAVGCVLVSNAKEEPEIIGVGFHPKAGYPHAEIFAIFEACNYVSSGVDAALAIVLESKHKRSNHRNMDSQSHALVDTIHQLLKTYTSEQGAHTLFQDKLSDLDVTAYVTLEPCCHFGKTPPCAMSLVIAGVQRVVVGLRDPNPRVDGGGVQVLQQHGIQVDFVDILGGNEMEKQNAKECQDIVKSFVNRIKPRDRNGNDGYLESNYEEYMTGAKRRLLRNMAGRQKQEGKSIEIDWTCSADSVEDASGDDLEEAIQKLDLNHIWMERVDEALWKHELIVLRLTRAVKKKKGVKLLSERIADELKAHVAQTVGHTALLYRPARPPVMNLDEMLSLKDEDDADDDVGDD